FELAAVAARMQLAAVGVAVFGIEDLAAVPHVAVATHVPQYRHADDRLLTAFAAAFLAARRRVLAGFAEQLDDTAVERVVMLAGLDPRPRFVPFVVDGLPQSDGRRLGAERRRRGEQAHGAAKDDTVHRASLAQPR